MFSAGILSRLAGPLGAALSGVLLLVSLCGAGWLWFDGQKVARQRDAAVQTGEKLISRADRICAAGGVVFRLPKAKFETWGDECEARVRYLARFEFNALKSSHEAMQQAMAETAEKSERHRKQLQINTTRRQQARGAMEVENAKVLGDEAGGHFFRALNRLAGLRPPVGREIREPGADGADEAHPGSAGAGPADLPSEASRVSGGPAGTDDAGDQSGGDPIGGLLRAAL